MDFEEVIESRRSVRKFDGKPIPKKIIERVLDLALLAPNSSNLQTWAFKVVTDEGVKKQLSVACFSQNAALTSSVMIVALANRGKVRSNCQKIIDEWPGGNPPQVVKTYYQKIAPMYYSQGPFSLLGYMKKFFYYLAGFFRPVPREPNSHSEMKIWAAKSCALACEHIMLGFKNFGYDTCPMEGYDSKRVRKILKLDRKTDLVMIIAAGKALPEGIYHERMRFDRSNFISYI